MRAIVMRAFGGEDVLEMEDVADPSPGPGEALVRVGAVEVSSTRDIATRTGRHPFSGQVTLPHVLGGDFAGVVEAVGAGVDIGLVGRRVAASNSIGCGACEACRAGRQAQCPQLSMLGIHRWGSYAEYAAVPMGNLNEIPPDVSLAQAAAMAATGPIAFTQLKVAQIMRDAWMLVTGATGALGTMLAVLGAELGARVICLSRRPTEVSGELTVAARLNSSAAELTESLRELTGAAGLSAAIDNVAAGEVFARYFPALGIGARVVISGAIGGAASPVLPVPAAPFYLRSQSLLGVRTTTRPDTDELWRLVDDGLRLPGGLVRELPMHDAAVAHAQIARGERSGHTVLCLAT